MALSIVEVYASFNKAGEVYIAIFENPHDAHQDGYPVQKGWLILDEKDQVAEDSQDIYFDYSQALEDLLTLENKWSHG